MAKGLGDGGEHQKALPCGTVDLVALSGVRAQTNCSYPILFRILREPRQGWCSGELSFGILAQGSEAGWPPAALALSPLLLAAQM